MSGRRAAAIFAAAMLATVFAAPPAAAQAHSYIAVFGEGASRRPAWRMGWNADATCYPDMGNCPSSRQGAAWLARAAGGSHPGFGLAWGSSLGSGPRIEVSVDRTSTTGALGDALAGVFYLSSAGRPFPGASALGLLGSTPESELVGELVAVTPSANYSGASFTTGFSQLALTTAALNFLYDLPPVRGLTPTFGFGVGYSLVTVRSVFTASYPGYPQYETAGDSSLAGGSLATRVILGAQRRLSDRFGVGLELVTTRVAEAGGAIAYQMHPAVAGGNEVIRDLRRIALRLVLRTYY